MNKVLRKDSKLTAAQVAATVKRQVTVKDEAGNDVVKDVAIKASEVIEWAEYPDTGEIVVVTEDGHKFTGELPKGKEEKK